MWESKKREKSFVKGKLSLTNKAEVNELKNCNVVKKCVECRIA
jgi:hypothetical protein